MDLFRASRRICLLTQHQQNLQPLPLTTCFSLITKWAKEDFTYKDSYSALHENIHSIDSILFDFGEKNTILLILHLFMTK